MHSAALTSSISAPQEGSNHDEIFMQQSLLFSDTLQDLKNLRKQLYSAAEYFEVSYSKEEQKQMVVESLKDYAVKALINSVDHLGSIAYKVNSMLDEKIADVYGTELRLRCIEQRLHTCWEYIGRRGLSQQLLLIETPRHHKHYIAPVGEMKNVFSQAKSKSNSSRLIIADDNLQQFKNGIQVQAMTSETPRLYVRERERHALPSPRILLRQGNFSFTNPSINQKPEDPVSCAPQFPLMRSGSLLKRSTSPNSRQQNPSEPQTRRTVSLSAVAQRERARDLEQYSGKSKRLFKTLLSMRKSRNHGTAFYKFLDEY